MLTGVVKHKCTDALQVGNDSTKEGIKSLPSNLAGEVIIDITKQTNLDANEKFRDLHTIWEILEASMQVVAEC